MPSGHFRAWAHIEGEFVPADAEDLAAVRAAGVLAEKGYRAWQFQPATRDLTSWEDPHGGYWVVDPENGYTWEWSSSV